MSTSSTRTNGDPAGIAQETENAAHDPRVEASPEAAPLSFEQVLEQEMKALAAARSRDGMASDEWRPSGLAFSGGGIRSATFCLGVLQAICAKEKLTKFDYLSTVSGGGYIGAFLTTWIGRKDKDTESVQRQLKESVLASEKFSNGFKLAELNWLRRYSNYLTPRAGMLSLDTLTLIAAWLRNVLLNWVLLISGWWLVLLLPRAFILLVSKALPAGPSASFTAAGACGLLFLWLIFAATVHLEIQSRQQNAHEAQADGIDKSRAGLLEHALKISDDLANYTLVIPAGIWALATTWWMTCTPSLFDLAQAHPGVFAAYLSSAALLLVALNVAFPFFAALGELSVHEKDGSESTKSKFAVAFQAARAACGFETAGAIDKKTGRSGHKRNWWRLLKVASVVSLACLFSMTLGFLILCWIRAAAFPSGDDGSLVQIYTFLPPMILGALALTGVAFVGLAGEIYRERTREWWSRFTARLTLIAFPWLGAFVFAFYIPQVGRWALANGPRWLSYVSIGWILSTLLGSTIKGVERLKEVNRQRYSALLNVAAAVAVFLILSALAALGDEVLIAWSKADHPPLLIDDRYVLESSSFPPLHDLTILAEHSLQHVLLKTAYLPSFLIEPILAAALIFLLFGWRIEINKFSLQSVYKNRLVRCYLGASNLDRVANPFTGFDLNDDTSLASLARAGAKSESVESIVRPLHIFNTAMNLAQGKNLAWQERKAASFTFTPLHAGYHLSDVQGDCTDRGRTGPAASCISPDGTNPQRPPASAWKGLRSTLKAASKEKEPPPSSAYRPIAQYAIGANSDDGISIGGAMATSGAAISPAMGYHTRPTLSFLLTIFNMRLGRWCPNPGKRSIWTRRRSGFAAFRLLQELGGRTNEDFSYLYLSDGGHFENLGIYELVQRKCEFILAVDAAADATRSFEDLGNAVRKCRIDLGAEIAFNLSDLRAQPPALLPASTYIQGTITYCDGTNGRIVLIKASMCHPPMEPVDVQAYANRFTTFPQQSTVDQFFEESQFESYRRLGYFAGEAAHAELDKL